MIEKDLKIFEVRFICFLIPSTPVDVQNILEGILPDI